MSATNYPRTPAARKKALSMLRSAKMARSSDDFMRGNTAGFYKWLQSPDAPSVPEGPPVWICGDCHLGNLGPVCGPKGNIEIAVRDFDQTVIGNPAYAVIRLGLSLANDARASDMAGLGMIAMLWHLIEGYASAFCEPQLPVREICEKPEAVDDALEDAFARDWKDLARERIENEKPSIPLGRNLWPLSRTEVEDIRQLLFDEKVRRTITSLRGRDDDDSVELIDAAYWVKGCSSIGLLRYAALVQIGDEDGELCLMDIKEAVKPLAPSLSKDMPKNPAERVVRGAWYMTPPLGDRMAFGTIRDRPVFLRELVPQDLKLKIKRFSLKEGAKIARFVGAIIGHGHARQMDVQTRLRWHNHLADDDFQKKRVPKWLWHGVTGLMAGHEGSYLEHCWKHVQLIAANRREGITQAAFSKQQHKGLELLAA